MSRYCMIYFGYSPIKGFRFLEQIIYKNPILKTLFIVIISWTIIWHFRKKKKWGHRTNYLAGGPKLSSTPQILRIIQLKNLRSVIFVIYIIPYFLYEVILHYKRKKEKEKITICYKCPPLNRPWSSGSKVWHAKHKATMSSHVRLEITVHNPSIGHIHVLIQGKWHFTLGQNRRFLDASNI